MIAASPGERVMWIIIITLLAFYFVGSWFNRTRGRSIGRWLQLGLGVLGGKPAWKALGAISAGAQVTIVEALKPFRRAEIQYALLTREIPPLWAVEFLRGRRDLLILRAWFQSIPSAEFDVVPESGALRKKLNAESPAPLMWSDLTAGLALASTAPLDGKTIHTVEEFLAPLGRHVERLSLRRREPHLMLFLRLDGVERSPSSELLKSLRRLALAVVARGGDNHR